MENAHFQSIVKSFALERLVQAALGEGSLCCRFGLVRLLPAVPRGKMARFALIDCNITQPAGTSDRLRCKRDLGPAMSVTKP